MGTSTPRAGWGVIIELKASPSSHLKSHGAAVKSVKWGERHTSSGTCLCCAAVRSQSQRQCPRPARSSRKGAQQFILRQVPHRIRAHPKRGAHAICDGTMGAYMWALPLRIHPLQSQPKYFVRLLHEPELAKQYAQMDSLTLSSVSSQ